MDKFSLISYGCLLEKGLIDLRKFYISRNVQKIVLSITLGGLTMVLFYNLSKSPAFKIPMAKTEKSKKNGNYKFNLNPV